MNRNELQQLADTCDEIAGIADGFLDDPDLDLTDEERTNIRFVRNMFASMRDRYLVGKPRPEDNLALLDFLRTWQFVEPRHLRIERALNKLTH
jgi:hypothetical protein